MSSVTLIRVCIDTAVGLWPCLILSGVGIVTNTITIIVFARQLDDSASISLTVIAAVDLVKCVVGCVHRFSGILGFLDTHLAVNWTRVTYLLNTHLQNLGVPLVNVVTLYVTFERCLCVCVPLRVKFIVTRKVTVISLAAVSICLIVSLAPSVAGFYVTWSFDECFNWTMAQYVSTDVFKKVPALFNYNDVIYMLWTAVTFIGIIVLTIVIIARLKQLGEVRARLCVTKTRQPANLHRVARSSGNAPSCEKNAKKAVDQDEVLVHGLRKKFPLDFSQPDDRARCISHADSKVNNLSTRDAQLVKTLLLVVLVYVINILPRLVIAITRYVEPQFNAQARYHDLFLIAVDLTLLLDFISGSVHLSIHLSMSSHFKAHFNEIFGVKIKK